MVAGMPRPILSLLLTVTLTSLALQAEAGQAQPIADVHLHWKWNQKEVTTAEQAIEALNAQRVELAVVTGTPPELALELADLAPQKVVPIYGLYRIPGDWSRWYHDPNLLDRARAALETGRYRGIGEVHMIGGFVADWRTPVIRGLFELAAEYRVPVLVHTEFSRAKYMLGVCRAHPETRLLWAHAGSALPPSEVEKVLQACPNVAVELSARDPWRHVARQIGDEAGRLRPEWRKLVLDYADRFMVGSDPVWPVEQLDAWDQADTGWQEIGRFLDFHRGWMAHLPADVAERVRLRNAQLFFAK